MPSRSLFLELQPYRLEGVISSPLEVCSRSCSLTDSRGHQRSPLEVCSRSFIQPPGRGASEQPSRRYEFPELQPYRVRAPLALQVKGKKQEPKESSGTNSSCREVERSLFAAQASLHHHVVAGEAADLAGLAAHGALDRGVVEAGRAADVATGDHDAVDEGVLAHGALRQQQQGSTLLQQPGA